MAERALPVKTPEAKRENPASHGRKTEHSPSISTHIDRILFLQRTIGNQAVMRLIRSGALQDKLKIGQPGDKYEQEEKEVHLQIRKMKDSNSEIADDIESRIQFLRGSTTVGASPQRHSVVIRRRTASPSGSAGLNVIPCSSLPFLVGSHGGCASGRDFMFADHPSLSFVDTLKVLPFRVKLDTELLAIFAAELGTLAGSIGLGMISRFSSGSGTTLVHGTASPISIMAAVSGTFAGALGAVRRDIGSQIAAQASTGAIDCNRLNIPSASMPRISFTFSDGTTLKAAIGGTQGLNLYITSFTALPGSRTYAITLRFVICDDFGVDESDLYSPGLISFWVLQHERTGYRPFVNEIIIEPTITGSF